MEKDSEQLKQALEDLAYIKSSLAKTSGVFRFFAFEKAMRIVVLLFGILTVFFASVFYYLIHHYSSYAAIPASYKVALYLLLATAIILVSLLKTRNFLSVFKEIKADIPLKQLLKEVYSRQVKVLLVAFFLALTVVIIFLATHGLAAYIVSFIAIFYALMYKSFLSAFGMEDAFILAEWLLVTGLISLFLLDKMHSLMILNLTFGLGMILAAAVSYLFSANEGV